MSSAGTRPVLRIVGSALAAVIVTGGVAAAALAPWPTTERDALGRDVSPDAARSIVACDGPLLALGRDETAAGAITEAAPGALVSGSDGAAASEFALATPDRAAVEAPTAFAADPVGAERSDLAAASAATLADDDLRGLAVSACTRPSLESWLVGGSAATGASDLVLLTNPGDVAARVDLRVFGAEGAQDPVAGQDLVVAARAQRAVPLAALARGEESPVVRVTAEGAPVRASLQTALTRTLIAGGVDQVGATAEPAAEQVIPAVDVTVPPDGAASAGGLTARLMATASDATASVVVRDIATGAEVSRDDGIALVAGRPVALDVTGMPVGVYTVSVAADAPLVAAAWTSTDLGAPADFAWSTAAPPIDAPTLVAVAGGPSPVLAVSAATDATVTLTPLSGAAPQTLPVRGGSTASLPLVAGEVYRLDPGEATVRAAVGFSAAGQLGSYAVDASATAAAQLTVYP